jgi:hypothetical protein
LLLFFGINFTPSAAALDDSILDIASTNQELTTLVAALETAGLDSLLENNGPFTLFAPTDAAFAAVNDVVAGLNITQLRQTLLYHIVQGEFASADLALANALTTALGKDVSVEVQGDTILLNGSTAVTMSDIVATNGTIHLIDAVLLPPSGRFEPAPPVTPDEVALPEAPIVEEEIAEIILSDLADLSQEAFILTTLHDIEWSLVQMVGVLDRSPAGQYPSDCDEFYLYYQLSVSLLLEIVFSDPPFEFEDIYDLTFNAVLDGLIASEPVAFLCTNGGNGHLSAHNKEAARIGLENSRERLHRIIEGGEARTGLQTESHIAEAIFGEPTVEELEQLVDQFGGPFDVDVFYEDLQISQEIMRSMIGWLDKLADGQTVYCSEYALYYELLNLPTVFAVVPPAYLELYQGHLNAVLTVLDTSRPLLVFCDEGGNLSEFNFGLARYGLDQGYNRLERIIQEVTRRLDIKIE